MKVFAKEWLKDLLWEDVNDGEVVEDKIIETSRWSVLHDMVFKYEGKFYIAPYSVGATEQQDEASFE